MTEKAKVSQEVADALAYLERDGYNFDAAMKVQIKKNWKGYEYKNILALNDITAETFAKALLNGYEVELTPHEIIEEEYKKTHTELMELTMEQIMPGVAGKKEK